MGIFEGVLGQNGGTGEVKSFRITNFTFTSEVIYPLSINSLYEVITRQSNKFRKNTDLYLSICNVSIYVNNIKVQDKIKVDTIQELVDAINETQDSSFVNTNVVLEILKGADNFGNMKGFNQAFNLLKGSGGFSNKQVTCVNDNHIRNENDEGIVNQNILNFCRDAVSQLVTSGLTDTENKRIIWVSTTKSQKVYSLYKVNGITESVTSGTGSNRLKRGVFHSILGFQNAPEDTFESQGDTLVYRLGRDSYGRLGDLVSSENFLTTDSLVRLYKIRSGMTSAILAKPIGQDIFFIEQQEGQNNELYGLIYGNNYEPNIIQIDKLSLENYNSNISTAFVLNKSIKRALVPTSTITKLSVRFLKVFTKKSNGVSFFKGTIKPVIKTNGATVKFMLY